MDFTADELTDMRAAQTGHMMDTCVIQTCTQTVDSYGEMVETFTDGSEQDCGLDMRPGSERHLNDSTDLRYDATIRLAITQTPGAKDRIKVTKRFGETLTTPLVFSITGVIQRGASGIRLALSRVET